MYNAQEDVVIIGAGPAGMATAITLQRGGYNPLVIDKAVFPRDKTCAGLITAKTYNAIRDLGVDTSYLDNEVILATVNNVWITNKTKKVLDMDCNVPFKLTNRYLLDNALVKHYIGLGGRIIEGKGVSLIRRESHEVVLETGETIRYQYLVGADGLTGVTVRQTPGKKIRTAIGMEVDLHRDDYDFDPDKIILDVGITADGYFWVFPKGDYVTLGMGTTYQKGVKYREQFQGILRDYFNVECDYTIKGAMLPYGEVSGDVTHPDGSILLVGDAAGFIDVITGEGLFFALTSGRYAAEVIHMHYSDNSKGEAAQLYKKAVEDIIRVTERSGSLARWFYSFRSLALFLVKGRNDLMAYFCDAQISTYSLGYNVKRTLTSYFYRKR